MIYKIGFYNDKIEDQTGLENCSVIINNYNLLDRCIRDDDIIILKSVYSLFGIDSKKLRDIKKQFNLTIVTLDNQSNIDNKNSADLIFNIYLDMLDFIKSNLEQSKKVIDILTESKD